MAVFREYPYLYEGTLDYERDYLETYWRSPGSRVVLLRDAGRAVGASTCLPLAHEGPEFQAPFVRPEDYFYLGESVLLPEYRGQRWGHLFFDLREARARELGGFRFTCFCAVEREPRAGHRSLEPFWTGRGYQHHPELRCTFRWRDVGEESRRRRICRSGCVRVRDLVELLSEFGAGLPRQSCTGNGLRHKRLSHPTGTSRSR